MIKINSVLGFILLGMMLSCEHSTQNHSRSIQDSIEILNSSDPLDKITDVSDTLPITSELKNKSITTLNFNTFTITLNRQYQSNQLLTFDHIASDTIEIYTELGQNIEDQIITFKNKDLTLFTIEQGYETSISIMNEGAHCDLITWKHGHSEWKTLQKNQSDEFLCISYTENEKKLFPKISINELKQHVKANCGMEWFNRINTINSINDYPLTVNISKYFLRISELDPLGRKKKTTLISIENPMGC